MNKRKAFTLVELLVVISIISLLMAILIPVLGRVRKQAKAIVCRSNLKQWGLIWQMYTDSNNNLFPTGEGSGIGGGPTGDWIEVLWPYCRKRAALTCCPCAKRPYSDGGKNPFGAWSRVKGGWGNLKTGDSPNIGSYGLNEFINDPHRPRRRTDNRYWRTRNVKKAANIPVFFDSAWIDVWPKDSERPPRYDGEIDMDTYNEMHLVCINRHNGAINMLFLDSSVRRVGLKKLWTLKWHRTYNTNGRWSTARGKRTNWPEWMRKFKD